MEQHDVLDDLRPSDPESLRELNDSRRFVVAHMRNTNPGIELIELLSHDPEDFDKFLHNVDAFETYDDAADHIRENYDQPDADDEVIRPFGLAFASFRVFSNN